MKPLAVSALLVCSCSVPAPDKPEPQIVTARELGTGFAFDRGIALVVAGRVLCRLHDGETISARMIQDRCVEAVIPAPKERPDALQRLLDRKHSSPGGSL